jgi:small subunit ribosomal protein S2
MEKLQKLKDLNRVIDESDSENKKTEQKLMTITKKLPVDVKLVKKISLLTSENLISQITLFGEQFASKNCSPKLYPLMLGQGDDLKIIDRDHLTIRLKRIFRLITLITNPFKKPAGKILLVCTDPVHYTILRKAARMTKQPYVCSSWVHGLLTNWKQIISTKRVVEYSLAFGKFTKKKKKYVGLIHLNKLPDLLLVVNPTENIQAIREAKNMQIPVISFIDPEHPQIEEVDYWIPISCRSFHLIYYFFSLFVLLPWEQKRPNSKSNKKSSTSPTKQFQYLSKKS